MIKKEIKRFRDAFYGLWVLCTREVHGRFHALAFVAVVSAGICFHISAGAWTAILLASGLVISMEALNTAVEKMADFVHPDHHDDIRIIKDLAAGAVLWAAIIALAVACFVFVPKII